MTVKPVTFINPTTQLVLFVFKTRALYTDMYISVNSLMIIRTILMPFENVNDELISEYVFSYDSNSFLDQKTP